VGPRQWKNIGRKRKSSGEGNEEVIVAVESERGKKNPYWARGTVQP